MTEKYTEPLFCSLVPFLLYFFFILGSLKEEVINNAKTDHAEINSTSGDTVQFCFPDCLLMSFTATWERKWKLIKIVWKLPMRKVKKMKIVTKTSQVIDFSFFFIAVKLCFKKIMFLPDFIFLFLSLNKFFMLSQKLK